MCLYSFFSGVTGLYRAIIGLSSTQNILYSIKNRAKRIEDGYRTSRLFSYLSTGYLGPLLDCWANKLCCTLIKNRAKRKEDRKRMSYLLLPFFRELLVYVEPLLDCWVYKLKFTSTLTTVQIYTHLRDGILIQESIQGIDSAGTTIMLLLFS